MHLSRRYFLKAASLTAGTALFPRSNAFSDTEQPAQDRSLSLFNEFTDPPHIYSLAPFWFLNDELNEDELRRQLDDFIEHGVYGVVPHARMGLPESLAFMSDAWMHMLTVVVEHAARRGMFVILYDEAMYPSGSCAGQVVAANPRHAARCLERRATGPLLADEYLVYQDDHYLYVNTRSMGVIRGVHYGTDDNEPGAPAAADILNPESVASFLRLTHDRHYEALSGHFGKTIIGVFTDEPSMLGRRAKSDVRPWTWGFEEYLSSSLGYDCRDRLPALWNENHPHAISFRKDFWRLLNARLEKSYYKPYHDWCAARGVALTGHPSGSMEIGPLQYFHIPGQDVVWRNIEPFQEKSLEGAHSTVGKCSSSAKVHHGRARNLNECFGAYGWEFTWGEMRWLSNWLLARGVDMLVPHAFYYSVRGDRRYERPPDVGPNNVWWDRYRTYADYCRRISWLNAVGKQVCRIAVLGTPTFLPWRAARVLYEHQFDFNYLDTETLMRAARIAPDGLRIAEMHYDVLVLDGEEGLDPPVLAALAPLQSAGRLIAYPDPLEGIPMHAGSAGELELMLDGIVPPDLRLTPRHPDIRCRHMNIGDAHVYFIANEGAHPVSVAIHVAREGIKEWWDPEKPAILAGHPLDRLEIAPYQSRVLCVFG